jgi:peptidoglycan/LPS O-acetylase OafA/YrhL
MSRTGDREFVTLDGMRGIAAITIVALHTSTYFFPGMPPNANLAVDFFFTLSGFVLAHAYGEKLRAGLSALEFMIIRLKRLYPLYLLALVIWLPIGVISLLDGTSAVGPLAINLICGILYIPSPIALALYPLNPPAWSLFFELVANLWLGIFGKRLGTPALFATTGLAGVGMLAGTVFSGPMIGGDVWPTFWEGLIRVAYSFPAGILVYALWLRSKPPIEMPAIVIGAALLAMLAVKAPEHFGRPFIFLSVAAGFPLVVWFGARSKPRGMIAAACRWLGAISYALYAVHYPLFFAAIFLAQRFLDPGSSRWPWGVAFIACSIFTAHFAHEFDIAARRLLNDLIPRRKTAAAV